MKILVVDDESTILELAEELLTSAGYHVLKAQDGEQALLLALKQHPDLIILDLMLPKKTGFQVIREIREDPRVRDIPILILSALVSGDYTDPAIRVLDVAGFIDKTESVTSLVSRVQEILSKQAQDEIKPGSGADSIGNIEHKKTILVADDEPTILEVARQLLTAAGYDVLEASDGEQALALARKEHLDLILLDLLMPKMNGFQFVLEIRKDPKVGKTPILVLSGVVSGRNTDAYLHDLDVAGFIGKTQMATSLISRVQEVLSKQAHQVA